MMKFVVLAVFIACAQAQLSEEQYQSEFVAFVEKYEKSYPIEDIFNRYNIFKDNLDFVNYQNSQGLTWTSALNKFSDYTYMEKLRFFTGYNGPSRMHIEDENIVDIDMTNMASSLDWRSAGAVTPVKDQGQCGSCWAFSTTGALEGAHQISGGGLVSMSEQELVDCVTTCSGCNGGLMDYGFSWIQKNGICSEDAYPYKAVDGTCRPSCDVVAHCSGYYDIKDENDMMTRIAQGPISIAVNANNAFMSYSSGVFNPGLCIHRLNHGILNVGYGTDMSGGDYWIVKNSWGTGWGEQGYIRMARGGNVCGLADSASIPSA